MSFIDKLNSEEKRALEELRSRLECITLSPKLEEDSTLFFRFLKARDFKVDKAETMLLKHINWRKVYQIDTIIEDFKPKEYFLKYCTADFIGLDKEGKCIFYISSGKIDPSDILKCDTLSNVAKSIAWLFEKIIVIVKKENKKTNKQSMQAFFIIDTDGISLSAVISKAAQNFWLLFTHLLQDNYPELMKTTHVINAPSYFRLGLSIINAVMSNTMLLKIQVWGNTGWKEAILNAVDENVLPAFLGGKRKDFDGNPRCPSFVRHSEKISPEYYLSAKNRYFEDMDDVKSTVIPPSEHFVIYVNVTEKGSLIQWEFFAKGGDIGFGLSFQTNYNEENNMKEIAVIPKARYFTTDGNEKGFYRSQFVGKYAIIFDNTHSWLRSKEVLYRVMVINRE